MIKAACGDKNVQLGHFQRFQHNKVFIKRDAAGKGQRVIFGSMNFSVRGLYVQANNVIVVDDATTADMFAKAFDVAFADDVQASPFRQNPISQGYMVGSAEDTPALPKFSLAISPHTNWSVSLGPMVERLRKATSSVLFAVMAPTGGGPVLATLRAMAGQPTVFTYGTVETDHGLAVQPPDGAMGQITGFAALTKNVPAPFTKEFDGGMGMHIHDKFVVVDFNGDNPTVFTGSSNLAAGGEQANGDSLAMIEDASIANMFAVEALATFDHYHFRRNAAKATHADPITLWSPGKEGQPHPWWEGYYDQNNIKMRDRCLFAKVPLPAGMKSVKDVDWTAVDAAPPAKGAADESGGSARAPRKRAAGAGAAKTSAGRKPAAKKAAATRTPRARPAKAPAVRTTRSPAKKTTKSAVPEKAVAKKPAPKKPVPKQAPAKRATRKAVAVKRPAARRTAKRSATPRPRRRG